MCEALESSADRAELKRLVNIGDLKFPGCVHCPSRCQYGDEIEATTCQSLASDSARLAEIWQGRFGKTREAIVAELAQTFQSYAEQSESFALADERKRQVITFCTSLHARAHAPVLNDAGAKAANPLAWWGGVMAEGCGIK